jgi:hypothetical protein
MHGGQDVGVRVTKTRHSCTTAGVNIVFILRIDNMNAAGARGNKRGVAQ